MIAIIVHGGAGRIIDKDTHRRGTRAAAEEGFRLLKGGFSALDSVIGAVRIMEDDPVFNAGFGSALNILGEVEMDASVMLGTGEFGAVGSIRNLRHPIEVARLVMENTEHLLIVGRGAERIAEASGLMEENPPTEKMKERLKKLPDSKIPGTVGACAIDRRGNIAVATSTGGLLGKLPSRIGDSAIIGAGTYASRRGGVSATGKGEDIIRLMVAWRTVELMRDLPPETAIRKIVEKGNLQFGMIGVDKYGNVGFGFNTEDMAYAFIRDK